MRPITYTYPLDVSNDAGPVLEARGGELKLDALILEQLRQQATHPSTLAEDQEHLKILANQKVVVK